MEINIVKEISVPLKPFDYLAKNDAYVHIVEWSNGEGWTISFDDKSFDLSIGQLEAINYLTKTLEYNGKI